jgi:metallophosphoesterase superfamily enzyme
LVLPAFGRLTGGFVVKPSATDRIYISDGTQVVQVD